MTRAVYLRRETNLPLAILMGCFDSDPWHNDSAQLGCAWRPPSATVSTWRGTPGGQNRRGPLALGPQRAHHVSCERRGAAKGEMRR